MFSKAPPPSDSNGCQGGELLGDPADTRIPPSLRLLPSPSSGPLVHGLWGLCWRLQAVSFCQPPLTPCPGPPEAHRWSDLPLAFAQSPLLAFRAFRILWDPHCPQRTFSPRPVWSTLSGRGDGVHAPLFHDQKHVGVPVVSSSCRGDVAYVPAPTPRPCSVH